MRFINCFELGSHADKIGVLLVNLGTPDSPTTGAVRRYLREFLSDQRVVEIPKLAWQIILNGIILQVRPKKSAQAYRQIWTDAGSPLLTITQDIGKKLAAEFAESHPEIVVEIAMRYGTPNIPNALKNLAKKGCGRILVLPLYPQYSATTTASIFDGVTQEFTKWRTIPEIRFINSYYTNELYLDALAARVRHHWQETGKKRFLLMSFHGLPQRNVELGDPYQQQCEATAQRLAEKLSLSSEAWCLTFQSRFGPAKWLQPYTSETLEALPAKNRLEVDVVCPGFAADCLETLEEIAEENRDIFVAAGGKAFAYIPALNDSPEHIDCLRELCLKNLSGWLTQSN